jgi:hypothetical protein
MQVRTRKVLKTICIVFISLVLFISLFIGGSTALARRDRELSLLLIKEVINNPSCDLLYKNLSAIEKEEILSIVGTLKGKQYKVATTTFFWHIWYVMMEFDEKAIVSFGLVNRDSKPFPFIILRAPSLVVKEVEVFATFDQEEKKWIRTIDKNGNE